MSWGQVEGEYGAMLKAQFATVFDVTPNPKGATPTREQLDERAPTKDGAK